MKTLLLVAFALITCFGTGAGPMGHNALAIATAERIAAGTYDAPPELKDLLRDPRMRQMFAGGSVGPDLFPPKTHRGNQSEFTLKMLAEAKNRYEAAKGSGDSDRLKKAGEALAFSYGWLSHVATDLNVHPKVNATIGDTYDYNNEGEKLTHSALEAQLYAYLRRTAGLTQPYEAVVPYEFVAEQMGIDEAKVRQASVRLQLIASGEIASANQVKLSDAKLKEIWGESVRESMKDVQTFLNRPESFENWDLDCGKISTEDFEWLRKAVMELNGGKLPKDWGKRYLDLWGKVKDLPGSERAARLSEEFGAKIDKEKSTYSGVPGLAIALAKQKNHVIVSVERDRRYPSMVAALPMVPVQWSGAKFTWIGVIDEGAPFSREVTITGELANEYSLAWVKVVSVFKDTERAIAFTDTLEAKNIPMVPDGLWDEKVGDVTFCVWNDQQAPDFSGSLTTSNNRVIWDRTNRAEWSQKRSQPLIVVRFRNLKFGG